MKILALNFNQKGLGTWRRSFYFSRELARAGHNVTLMTVSRTSRFHRSAFFKRDWIGESREARGAGPWVRVVEGPACGYRFLPGWGSGPLDIWQRVREILDGDVDAVLGFEHHPNVSWPVYLTRRWRQFAFFSDWCDWFGGNSNHFRGWRVAHRIDSYLEEKIRKHADGVSVTSRLLFDRAISIGIPRRKVVQIPEGAATDYIVPLSRAEARLSLNMPGDVPMLFAVRNGDMCREVRIFGEVSRHVPRAVLVMVGSPSRPAMELASRLGLGTRIISTGWVDDKDYPVYLACADVCFCPLEDSLNDRARWPAKILDYLSAGRATVTNAVGEAGDLFREREVGVLAGSSDEEFASEIADLLRDSDRRQFLGESARRVMVEEWDWGVRRPQIITLLAS
jgi:glycosyltransferase involved in cell wall biosynthesis